MQIRTLVPRLVIDHGYPKPNLSHDDNAVTVSRETRSLVESA